eukprot:CAMPEP_0114395456 /NCGR_PEP_ID=MMETSP0102-20121206/12901_1 /TAXON_ID=38822 ORGANISM="Pteridomonas danica, Strain PT" /NCGR_SAMPLE_ID=MMETSP0102 /ASSEMBLY_ACC=CAM_ASM_000212 /LENGTH=66 /DNA_ID=CAMNT_0001555823 /DNA_START=95 /DNA_END=292 /DNA_ORIENTATION=-
MGLQLQVVVVWAELVLVDLIHMSVVQNYSDFDEKKVAPLQPYSNQDEGYLKVDVELIVAHQEKVVL